MVARCLDKILCCPDMVLCGLEKVLCGLCVWLCCLNSLPCTSRKISLSSLFDHDDALAEGRGGLMICMP